MGARCSTTGSPSRACTTSSRPTTRSQRSPATTSSTRWAAPLEARTGTYAERTNLNRVPDIAASGVRGVILIHALEDGTVPYNQSREMTQALRDGGVPTDFYTVGGRGSDEPDTTLGGYVGVNTGNAGHGWEGSSTHVFIQTGFDRLNALVTRAEPAPCNRDFRVDERPSTVMPDPREAPAGCKPDPLPPATTAGTPCRDSLAPSRPVLKLTGRRRRPVLRGRAGDRGCGRIARVFVAVARTKGGKRCRFLGRSGRLEKRRTRRRPRYLRAAGRESWRLRVRRRLPRGRCRVTAVAIDAAGHRSPARRVRFRVR